MAVHNTIHKLCPELGTQKAEEEKFRTARLVSRMDGGGGGTDQVGVSGIAVVTRSRGYRTEKGGSERPTEDSVGLGR